MHLTRKLFVAAIVALALVGCSKDDGKSFQKVDHNKDGKIIFEELIVAYPDLTVQEFLAADSDHNGSLDAKEYQRFKDARQAGKKLTPTEAPKAAAKTPEQATGTVPTTTPAGTPNQAEEPSVATSAASSTPPASANAPADTLGQPPAAQAPKEEVETVVAPENPAPKASTETTYVIKHGDSLITIARKFKVSPKAIMAANDMKNPDRLTAGESLTIPSGQAAASTAPQAVTAFVEKFFTHMSAGDVNALLDSYGPSVKYYKKHRASQDVIRQDKVGFFQRWPKRTYTPGAVTLEKKSKKGNLRISVPVKYSATAGAKSTEGQAVFTFVLHPDGKSYRIVEEKSVVAKGK